MAFEDLATRLKDMPEGIDASDLQTLVYEIGKAHEFENLRDWFKALYEVLLGQSQGPRFGSFVALYGVQATRDLIARGVKGTCGDWVRAIGFVCQKVPNADVNFWR